MKRVREFSRVSLLLGMFLAVVFGTMLTVFAGGLVRSAVLRQVADGGTAEKFGTLVAAGIIAGEGLAGIALALIAVCA